MIISMNKKYETQDGREVRILCVDAEGLDSVVGLIDGVAERWHPNGVYFDEETSNFDLVEVKETHTIIRWINIYFDDESYHLWESREEADEGARKDRVACKQVCIMNKKCLCIFCRNPINIKFWGGSIGGKLFCNRKECLIKLSKSQGEGL